MTANLQKVKVSHTGKSAASFWIGCRVLSEFNAIQYVGTVDDVEVDGTQTLFHVCYEDFGEEELDLVQVQERVIYHPALDSLVESVFSLPGAGTFILFSHQQQPRLGQVKEVRDQDRHQLVVHLWKPHRKSRDFVSARFRPASSEGDPTLVAVTLSRVRARNLEMSDRGYLSASSRKLALKILKKWRSS